MFDAHLHLIQCSGYEELIKNPDYNCITCCHEKEEFFKTESVVSMYRDRIKIAYGIHPQNPDMSQGFFLEELLRDKRIDAIGECGFDLFPEFRHNLDNQKKAFELCILLASKYQVPAVIHLRKGLNYIFEYVSILKKIPLLIFHSFPFTYREAESLLAKGLNAKFSFGKQLFKGSPKAEECIKVLPEERILFETDAPYQVLKNQAETFPSEIYEVSQAGYRIRNREYS